MAEKKSYIQKAKAAIRVARHVFGGSYSVDGWASYWPKLIEEHGVDDETTYKVGVVFIADRFLETFKDKAGEYGIDFDDDKQYKFLQAVTAGAFDYGRAVGVETLHRIQNGEYYPEETEGTGELEKLIGEVEELIEGMAGEGKTQPKAGSSKRPAWPHHD